MARFPVNLVYDDVAGEITFEVPNDDGSGDTVLTIAVPEDRVLAIEDTVDQLVLDALTGGTA